MTSKTFTLEDYLDGIHKLSNELDSSELLLCICNQFENIHNSRKAIILASPQEISIDVSVSGKITSANILNFNNFTIGEIFTLPTVERVGAKINRYEPIFYCAPEILAASPSLISNTAIDVYLLGALAYHIFSGEPHRRGRTHMEIANFALSEPTPSQVAVDYKDLARLIIEMMQFESLKRPSLPQIKYVIKSIQKTIISTKNSEGKQENKKPDSERRTNAKSVNTKNREEPLRLIHEYRIVDTLGIGEIGTVYKACKVAEKLQKPYYYAIKILNPNQQQWLPRFSHEISLLQNLKKSKHVVTFYEYNIFNGRPYFVMEYINGETLAGLVAFRNKDGLSELEIMMVAWQISIALLDLHSRKIVHRDIKPQNIMIDLTGHVKVLDFGIAKSKKHDDKSVVSSIISVLNATGHGAMLGTPGYCAPEQIAQPSTVTPAADVYSLGKVLLFLLSGTNPGNAFKPQDSDLSELIKQMLLSNPELRPTTKEVFSILTKLILKRKGGYPWWFRPTQLAIASAAAAIDILGGVGAASLAAAGVCMIITQEVVNAKIYKKIPIK